MSLDGNLAVHSDLGRRQTRRGNIARKWRRMKSLNMARPILPQSLLRLIPSQSTRDVIRHQASGILKGANLYETVASLPKDGVGSLIRQTRWLQKGHGAQNSWWEVTRVKLKDHSKHGKVWGRLYWNGIVILAGELMVVNLHLI